MACYKRSLFSQLRFFFLRTNKQRINYLKKHKVFSFLGDNVFYRDRRIPVEPGLIKIHNNVVVASGVNFIPHDVIHMVFNKDGKEAGYRIHLGCIEILDNCFIGSGSIILPNVRIGPNSIVAAGSIVTKDVPPGTIVGGNPARIIGYYDDLRSKRTYDKNVSADKYERYESLWNDFYESRKLS